MRTVLGRVPLRHWCLPDVSVLIWPLPAVIQVTSPLSSRNLEDIKGSVAGRAAGEGTPGLGWLSMYRTGLLGP